MRRTFKTINVSDFDLSKVQANVQAAVTDLFNAPELNPSYVEVETAAATDLVVNHQLGREFGRYEIVRSNADVRIWESATVNRNPSKQLILNASGAATITIKVY